LFAGVLDGGESEVFLGGSRLSRFMETVERATTTIAPAPEIEPSREGTRGGERKPTTAGAAASPAPATADGWPAVVQAGLAFLEQVAAASRAPAAGGGVTIVHRDPQTGEGYLRIPMPAPEVMDR